ncbi:MAG: ribbon-helix-helix protein, CopG family [Gemmatimonadetes bacterium]|nr:ribbon-helix-helix protein, CopG family [Gemmatimonadota bacterium]
MAKPRKLTHAVMVRIPEPMIEALDRLRAEKPDHPSRPEMIRRIVADWLEDNESSGRNLRA